MYLTFDYTCLFSPNDANILLVKGEFWRRNKIQ